MKLEENVECFRNRNSDVFLASLSKQKYRLEQIVGIDDVYLAYFYLTKLELESNDESLGNLHRFITRYRSTAIPIETDFDTFMISFLKSVKVSNERNFLKCLSQFDLSDTDVDHFRKAFGYSRIYQHYKTIISESFEQNFCYRELSLVIRLLNNEILCYKRLLPIFTKLTAYVNQNVLDKNILTCCVVLRSVVDVIPGVLDNRDEYIASVISYLIEIMYDTENFMFLTEKDTHLIVGTISSLTKYNFAMKRIKNIAVGLFRECKFNLQTLMTSSTVIYEETVSICCLVEILHCLYLLYNAYDGEVDDMSDFYTSLQQCKLSRPMHLDAKEWMDVEQRFYVAKYRLLNTMHTEHLYTPMYLYDELLTFPKPSQVLRQLDRVPINWSELISYACNDKFQYEFIEFIFKSRFVSNAEHLTYLELFIDASANNYDSCLISTILFLRESQHKGLDKHWSIVLHLYLHGIESEDQRVVKRRKKILAYLENNIDYLPAMTEQLVYEIATLPSALNLNVIELINTLLARVTSTQEANKALYNYLLQSLVHSRVASREEAVCVATISRLFAKNGIKVETRPEEDYHKTYYHILVGVLSYSPEAHSEAYFNQLKAKIFDFLFIANKRHIEEIGKIMHKGRHKDKPSKYKLAYDQLLEDRIDYAEPEKHVR